MHFRLLASFLLPLTAFAQTPGARAVWVQQVSGEPDPYAAGGTFRLMARELPGPPRVLLAGPGNFSRPLLSADGRDVYYTNRHAAAGESGTAYAPEMFSVPFAGGEPKKLGAGMAVAVWPEADGEYIYALNSLQTSRRPALTGEMLMRFNPATPDDREIMWTESPLGADNFQLSRDGMRAAGLFPWPQAGLADMDVRTFAPLGQGSFPGMAPDNSYAVTILDGDRRRLRVYVPGVEPGWDLLPAQSLPQQGGEINHPRWSNDPLHLTFSGPPASGTAPDVYLATLRPDLREILSAVPLSDDPAPDYFPDVWIAGSRDHATTLTQRPVVAPRARELKWPVSGDALQFSWENAKVPGGAEVFSLRGGASPGRDGSLNVSTGWAEASGASVAGMAPACAASGSVTLEALITERRTQDPCSVRILGLRTADGRDALALYRVDRSLVVRILTGSDAGSAIVERHPLTVLGIEDDRPFSVLLTVHAGRLQLYLDGQPMKGADLEKSGLAAWSGLTLTAGDPQPYGTPWTGRVERLACYSRALAAAEIADGWLATQKLLIARTRPTRNKIKARLIEMPALPDDKVLAAAPHWLLASAWEADQIFLGSIKPKQRITLLQWAVLDGKKTPLPAMQPGQTIELPLESLDDHPELRDVKTHNSLSAGEAPVFFDTTPPGRHPQPFSP